MDGAEELDLGTDGSMASVVEVSAEPPTPPSRAKNRQTSHQTVGGAVARQP
ncbi:hypothetical protein [Streptomyces sp. NPDC058457]|uniref:hypothetical protein n=1 Tax=Streptomyces sp. NPDC058457 TaxID=3346507 RepID=UPI003655AD4A